MLGEVFHINVAEVAQSDMQCDFSKSDTLKLEAFHDLAAEMQAGSGSGNCPFIFGKNGLVALIVFMGDRPVMDFRKRGFAKLLYGLFKLVIRSIE